MRPQLHSKSIVTSMAARILPLSSLLLLASFSALPMLARGDILCTQFGTDTFRPGQTIKFFWNDTGTVPIETFSLDMYCYENRQLIQTLATLNASTSTSPQIWVADETILNSTSVCPYNQYQGAFDWTYIDPNTGAQTSGSSVCKTMLLVAPGVITPSSVVSDPSDAFPTDDPTPGPIVITDRTKHIVIGVGAAVGALVLAGFVAFYVVRFKNNRAEQDQVNKKLREPLHSPLEYDGNNDDSGGGMGFAAAGAAGLRGEGRYNELPSVRSSLAGGYSPVSTRPGGDRGEVVEMSGLAHAPLTQDPYPTDSRPQSYSSGSTIQTPASITANHFRNLTQQQQQQQQYSSPNPFANNAAPTVIDNPFAPSPNDVSETMRYTDQDQEQQLPQRRLENETLEYEQQQQQLQHQQQQQQAHLQQQQQQQQQLSYGNYY